MSAIASSMSRLIVALALAVVSQARAEPAARLPTPIAVIDFDYHDTSGETTNQAAEHEQRLRRFMSSLRHDLEAGGGYRVIALYCGAEPCSLKRAAPDELFDAARKAGARLLLYGGVHKMSTLVQWAKLQVVDIEKDVVIEDRHFSFRGDDDEAWRRAERFIVANFGETARPH